MSTFAPFAFSDLAGRTLLITGTTRGIGRALLPGFLEQGLRLVLVGMPLATMQAIRTELGVDDTVMRLYACDLADPQAVVQTADDILANEPVIDAVLHNAAIDPRHRFESAQDLPLWQRVWQVNLQSPVMLTQALLERLKQSEQGRIIFVGSVMSQLGGSYVTAYAASKGGLEALTRSLAHELKGTSVTVNCIAPGAIQVEKENPDPSRPSRLIDWQSLPRRLTPRDLFGPICLLLSQAGQGINAQTITVDGGLIHPIADPQTQHRRLTLDQAARATLTNS